MNEITAGSSTTPIDTIVIPADLDEKSLLEHLAFVRERALTKCKKQQETIELFNKLPLITTESDAVQKEVVDMFIDHKTSKPVREVLEVHLKKQLKLTLDGQITLFFILKPWAELWVKHYIAKDKLLPAILTKFCIDNLKKEECKQFFINQLIPIMFSKHIADILRVCLTNLAHELVLKHDFICELTDEQAKLYIKDVSSKYVETLGDLRKNNYADWHKLWIFLVRFSGKHIHSTMDLMNKLLRVVEYAFRSPSCQDRIVGYDCWKELINNASLDVNHICSSKQIKLLVTPLKARFSKQEEVIIKRFEVFVYLLEKLQENATLCVTEFLEFCFGAVPGENQDVNKSGQGKYVSKIWSKSSQILMEIIGHNHPCKVDIQHKITLQEPIINCTNFEKYFKIITHSVTVASARKNEQEQFRKCMWNQLLSLIGTVPEDTKIQSFKMINNFIINYFKENKTTSAISEQILTEILFEIFNFEVNDINKFIIEPLLNVDKNDPDENILEKTNFWLRATQVPTREKNIIPGSNFWAIFMWPVSYIHKFPTTMLEEVLLSWSQMYSDFSEKSPEAHDRTIAELMKIFDNNPLLSSNILTILEIIADTLEAYKEDFLIKILNLLNLIVILPKMEEENKASIIIKNFLNSKLSIYKLNPNPQIITSLCSCVEHILQNHKDFSILETLIKFLQEIPTHVQIIFSKQLLIKILAIFNELGGITSNTSKDLRKIIQLLDQDPKKKINNVSPFVQPLGRSKMMSQLVQASNAKIIVESPTTTALTLFGKNVTSTFSPNKVKGSQLNNTPTKQASKIVVKSPAGRKKATPSINDEKTSDFVPIDTEIKFDKEKLSEHQKEVLQKRREDIPALYQDLSQSQSLDMFKPKTSNSDDKKLDLVPEKPQIEIDKVSNKENSVEPVEEVPKRKSINVIPQIILNERKDDEKIIITLPLGNIETLAPLMVTDSANSEESVKNEEIVVPALDQKMQVANLEPEKVLEETPKPANEELPKIASTRSSRSRKMLSTPPVDPKVDLKVSKELRRIQMDIVGADQFINNLPSRRSRSKSNKLENDTNTPKRPKTVTATTTPKEEVKVLVEKSPKICGNSNKTPQKLSPQIEKVATVTPEESKKENEVAGVRKRGRPFGTFRKHLKEESAKKRKRSASEDLEDVIESSQEEVSSIVASPKVKTPKLSKIEVGSPNYNKSHKTAEDELEMDVCTSPKLKTSANEEKQTSIIASPKEKIPKSNKVESLKTLDGDKMEVISSPKVKTSANKKTSKIEDSQEKISSPKAKTPKSSKLENLKTLEGDKMEVTSSPKVETSANNKTSKMKGSQEEISSPKAKTAKSSKLDSLKTLKGDKTEVLPSPKAKSAKASKLDSLKVLENDSKLEACPSPKAKTSTNNKTSKSEDTQEDSSLLALPKPKTPKSSELESPKSLESDSLPSAKVKTSANNKTSRSEDTQEDSSLPALPKPKTPKSSELESPNTLENDSLPSPKVKTSANNKTSRSEDSQEDSSPRALPKLTPLKSSKLKSSKTLGGVKIKILPKSKVKTSANKKSSKIEDMQEQDSLILAPPKAKTPKSSKLESLKTLESDSKVEVVSTPKVRISASKKVRKTQDQDSLIFASTKETPNSNKMDKSEENDPKMEVSPPKADLTTEEEPQTEKILDESVIIVEETPLEENTESLQKTPEPPPETENVIESSQMLVAVVLNEIDPEGGVENGTQDTETCESTYPSLTPDLQWDVIKKPELTDSERMMSAWDTISIISETISQGDTIIEKTNEPEENQETEIVLECNEATEINAPSTSDGSNGTNESTLMNSKDVTVVVIGDCPSPKRPSLPTSPVTGDTPNRTIELLSNTLDISPINVTNKDPAPEVGDPPKIDNPEVTICENPPIINGRLERSSRMLNMLNADSPVSHRLIPKKRAMSMMSPSTTRMKKLMSNLHQSENKTEEFLNGGDQEEEEILVFSREVPSPLAVPKSSILKRKFSDDDALSPCSKRKRVNFSDPPTTSKKVFIKENNLREKVNIEGKNLFNASPFVETVEIFDDVLETEVVGTEESLCVINPLLLRENRPIYPDLVTCNDNINVILCKLTSPIYSSSLLKKLQANGIKTIGDFAGKSEAEINRLSISKNVYKILDKYYLNKNKTVQGVLKESIFLDIDEQFKSLLGTAKLEDLGPTNADIIYVEPPEEKPLLQNDIAIEVIKISKEEAGVEENQEEEGICKVDPIEETVKPCLSKILQNFSLPEIKTGLEETLNEGNFIRKDFMETCLVPLVDASSYLESLTPKQLGDFVNSKLNGEEIRDLLGGITQVQPVVDTFKEGKGEEVSTKDKIVEETAKKPSFSDIVTSFETFVDALPSAEQSEALVNFFRIISSKIDASTLVDLHVEFLRKISPKAGDDGKCT